MTLSRGSLSGQNTGRRATGSRSSRLLSTIFKQLRKLDSEISKLDSAIKIRQFCWGTEGSFKVQRARLDEKRRAVRERRKAMGFAFRHGK